MPGRRRPDQSPLPGDDGVIREPGKFFVNRSAYRLAVCQEPPYWPQFFAGQVAVWPEWFPRDEEAAETLCAAMNAYQRPAAEEVTRNLRGAQG